MKVGVYFQEREIAEVFADLVCSMGAEGEVIDDLRTFSQGELQKIVTEPVFFRELPEAFQERCLLVGNKDALRRFPAASLSRPLTEEKVTQALGAFLETSPE